MTFHPPYGRARWATAGPAPNLGSIAAASMVEPVDSLNAWLYLLTLAPFTRGGATPSEAVGQVPRGGPGLLFAL